VAGWRLAAEPHTLTKNTKPDSVLSIKSGGHVWGGGGLQSFERAGDGPHEEQPASLGSAGEMSVTILAERRYLRTERQTEDLSTRQPAAHRLSILSDVGCLFLEASEFAQNSPADVCVNRRPRGETPGPVY
jgi:hypothetical protein